MYRYGVNTLESALSPLVKIGLKSVLIFGVPTKANKVSKHYDNYQLRPGCNSWQVEMPSVKLQDNGEPHIKCKKTKLL